MSTFEYNDLFTYTIEKNQNKNFSHSHCRPPYPYLQYWNREKNILNEAYDQIESTKTEYSEIEKGMIVIDFAGLRFDVRETAKFASEQLTNKEINTTLMIMRTPGMQEPNRTDFSSDFFIVRNNNYIPAIDKISHLFATLIISFHNCSQCSILQLYFR